MGSLGSLGIAVSGLYANQRSLDVTGHNISNVNTPGYARQSAVFASSVPQAIGYTGAGVRMQRGTGVDLSLIQQYRDEFLDIKFRRANKELGYWDSTQRGIEELEAIFNDLSEEGIQSAMEKFWYSWDQLSKPTGRLTARALVKENAIALVESLQHADQLLKNFRKNKDNEIVDTVSKINDISKRIAGLNDMIMKVEGSGAMANDFRDERNMLIDELSALGDIQVVYGSTVAVLMEGRALVDFGNYEELEAIADPDKNGFVKLIWKNDKSSVNIQHGRMKALFDTRDELVDSFRIRLDEMVKGLANEVNKIHSSGYGIKDDIQRKFFINKGDPSSKEIDIGSIAFNPELNDYDNIAAALDMPPYNNEDNRIALMIVGLREKNIFTREIYDESTGRYGFDEYYRNIIMELGRIGIEATIATEAQISMIKELSVKKGAIMDVSIDEEMSNLIRFEHSYNACARMVNVMDEMLDIVVNRLGVAGR